MQNKKYLWKSLGEEMISNNDFKWEVDRWYHQDGKISCCNNGFHASERMINAMGFVDCEVLALVEVKGDCEKEKDKQCWSDMRIVKAYKWTKKDSVKLAIFAAELTIKNFEKKYPNDKRPREAIEAAKNWLKNPTEKNRSAARSAALSARSAASAARSAESAWSAARSAESAAWSAESAAWSAARSADSAEWSAWSAWSANKILIKCEKYILKEICNNYFNK